MLRFRARAIAAALAAAAALTLTIRGRAQDALPLQISDVGLPAIEEGMIRDDSHTPSSPQARAARAAMMQPRADGSVARAYRPGRVIVRFRDEVPADERRSIVRSASASGDMTARPVHAAFALV